MKTNTTITSLLCFSLIATSLQDTVTTSNPLQDSAKIASPNQVFELGFFTPTGTSNRYLGIWYKNIPDSPVVWVANRDNPVTSSPASLNISGRDLVILDGSGKPVWSTNQTEVELSDPFVELLDSGNLVLSEANGYRWQSFDYPTDTLLPGMKLGWVLKTGMNRVITSWRDPSDPSSGSYRFEMDPRGDPEVFLWNGPTRVYRSGPWDGVGFSGVPEMKSTDAINFTFLVTGEEVFYSFEIMDESLVTRLVVNSSGYLQRFTWIPDQRHWGVFWYAPKDQCDTYLECGPYSLCDTNDSPVCSCFVGFRPKNPQAWNLRDGSDGCVRDTGLGCSGDGFLRLKGAKLPDTSRSFLDEATDILRCEEMCRENCSCTGYASSKIVNGGNGCVIWYGEMLDARQYEVGGQDLFVRLAASELQDLMYHGIVLIPDNKNSSDSTRRNITLIIATCAGILILVLAVCAMWKRNTLLNTWKRNAHVNGLNERSQNLLLCEAGVPSKRDSSNDSNSHEFELPLFDFNTVVLATNNFSETLKLGQGGFGIVYKGVFMDGQEVAVKRLSQTSKQGAEEFKNEVKLIAKLQHRNLVRLLGCSVKMDEKMLIYEYMHNRSLDSIIFNKDRCSLLNWQTRFNIICGIARGLLYLHQDSRYRIIHRDLKASNILLDAEMNPKISDFGMARIFGGDQIVGNTCRVVGTYGYMSPEYAMDGNFSVKSDVFSFGVLILEIISGKRNRGFFNSSSQHNLLGHTWGLWREGKGVELIDSAIGDSNSAIEVLRCLQVGLICVQERPEDRPTIESVLLMLSSENPKLMEPKQPGFCIGRNPNENTSSSSNNNKLDETITTNRVTITVVQGR